MRILEIVTVPFFAPRGTAFSTLERTKAFSRLGHRVEILAYPLGEDVTLPGVTIHRLPRVPGIRTIRMGPSAKKLALDLLLAVQSLWWLARRRFDLIHVHEESAYWVLALRPFLRTPVLYDMHSSLVQQLGNFGWGGALPRRCLRFLERMAIRRADGIIVVFPELRSRVEEVRPDVPVAVIENLPVGWDLPPADPAQVRSLRERLHLHGKRVLLYTGNFGPNQGLEMAVEACRLVRREAPESVLLLVGGPEHDATRIRAHAAALGCSQAVVFVEPQPPRCMPAFMELAEVLLSPRTAGTNTPLKIYSYLASGRPIVATRLATHLQVLDETTARLVEPTPSGLAKGVLDLLRDPEAAAQLGRAGRRRAEDRCGIEGYTRRVEEILARTCVGAES